MDTQMIIGIGMEDDDLFWRCVLEGYLNLIWIILLKNKVTLNFNGKIHL